MATLTSAHSSWANTGTQTNDTTLYAKWLNFTDSQKKNRTFWFLLSLISQGVLFLPIPATLIFYYNAPVYIIAITLTLFFANVISGMGGSSIRTMMSLFALSVIIHLVMLAAFIL